MARSAGVALTIHCRYLAPPLWPPLTWPHTHAAAPPPRRSDGGQSRPAADGHQHRRRRPGRLSVVMTRHVTTARDSAQDNHRLQLLEIYCIMCKHPLEPSSFKPNARKPAGCRTNGAVVTAKPTEVGSVQLAERLCTLSPTAGRHGRIVDSIAVDRMPRSGRFRHRMTVWSKLLTATA